MSEPTTAAEVIALARAAAMRRNQGRPWSEPAPPTQPALPPPPRPICPTAAAIREAQRAVDTARGHVPTIRRIQHETAAQFGLTIEDMLTSRAATVRAARHVAMALCRDLAHKSYPEIGRHFSRDHTTARYAVRITERRIAVDSALNDVVERIKSKVTCEREAASLSVAV